MTTPEPSPPEPSTPEPAVPPQPPSFHEQHLAWLLSRSRRAVRIRLLIMLGCVVLAIVAVIVAFLVLRVRRLRTCREFAVHYGAPVDLDPDLVLAVIEAESAGDPKAVSRAGARGLMQLMQRTAEETAQKAGLPAPEPDDLFDPHLNVQLGTLYLAWLRRLFDDDPRLYIAAYNAGPGNVDKWRLQNPTLSSEQIIDQVAFEETRTYVRRVLRLWKANARKKP